MIEGRTALPVADYARGKRSPVTCRLKCADACSGPECNTTENPTFRSLASIALTRRAMIGLGAAGVVALAAGVFRPAQAAAAASGSAGMATQLAEGAGPRGGLAFTPIAPVASTVDAVSVPIGYAWQSVIRWGDPLFSDAPTFRIDAQTPESQSRQFGYNNDYLDIIHDKGGLTGVLVANHEYVNPGIMFPPTTDATELRRRGDIYKVAQGFSVVEVVRDRIGGAWRPVVDGKRNRRLTVNSPFELTGPVAGNALVRTAADPRGRIVSGTLGNCSGGTTPWGTVLSGEENFDGYFAWAADTDQQRRYRATSSTATATGWESYDPRFNAHDSRYVNEPNRFGYIVEIDPQDPTSTPVKHTAMGRFKHEGANVHIAKNGHAVAYMGDDERGDYLYKFVSKHKFNPKGNPGARKQNRRLLAEGDLFVARFSGNSPAAEITGTGVLPSDGAFDGLGEWVALTKNGESRVAGMSVHEVLVYTRLAADTVGATKMDRCEDVQPHPTTGRVYVACTNNTNRGTAYPADEANPRGGNRDGHIIELTEVDGHAGNRFGWSILLLCGDPASPTPTYFAGFPKGKVSPISCPDNVAFDDEGNLWISTDGAPSTIRLNDGLFKVPLDGPERGHVQQFLSVPRDAETCGPVIHSTEGSVFVAVQHPGENGSFAAPTSLFPDYGRTGQGNVATAPRPAVIQVYRPL